MKPTPDLVVLGRYRTGKTTLTTLLRTLRPSLMVHEVRLPERDVLHRPFHRTDTMPRAASQPPPLEPLPPGVPIVVVGHTDGHTGYDLGQALQLTNTFVSSPESALSWVGQAVAVLAWLDNEQRVGGEL